MNNATVLTREKYEELVQTLTQLKTVGRDEIAEKIKEARSHGDLSENAEYDEAMNDQAKLEAQIAKIEEELKNATILDESSISSEVVGIGSEVDVENLSLKKKMTFKILGKGSADPFNGVITADSPIGKALIGKKVGEKVEVEIPNGTVTFKILKTK